MTVATVGAERAVADLCGTDFCCWRRLGWGCTVGVRVGDGAQVCANAAFVDAPLVGCEGDIGCKRLPLLSAAGDISLVPHQMLTRLNPASEAAEDDEVKSTI